MNDAPPRASSLTIRFRFTHHRGSRLIPILDAAKQGQYEEPPIALAPGVWHKTSFDLSDRAQMQAALTLAELLLHHPCAEAYWGDSRIGMSVIAMVLRCYEKSWSAGDSHAYCWTATHLREHEPDQISYPVNLHLGCDGVTATCGPRTPRPPTWFWPCRCTISSAQTITTKHLASLRHQVEAALSAAQVQWCPRLQHLDAWELFQWGKPNDGT